MTVHGAFFEVTSKEDELHRICAAIEENDGRLTADSSMSLDLWQEMYEEWFKIHDAQVLASRQVTDAEVRAAAQHWNDSAPSRVMPFEGLMPYTKRRLEQRMRAALEAAHRVGGE